MVRVATIQDAPAIADIHVQAWKAAYRGIVPDAFLRNLDVEQRIERWVKILQEARSQTYVYENCGRITAWISVGQSRDEDTAECSEVWALYVSPESWRRGSGRALMKFAEKIAVEAETFALVLWVLEGNQSGRAFYEKMGFTSDGLTKLIEIEGVSLQEIRYHKRLKQSNSYECNSCIPPRESSPVAEEMEQNE